MQIEENSSSHCRGLHMLIICPISRKIKVQKCFDTYTSSEDLEKLIDNEILDGDFVIAACKDECARNLSHKVKAYFSEMGSTEIWNL